MMLTREVEMKWAKEKLVLLKEGSIKPKLVNISEQKPEKNSDNCS